MSFICLRNLTSSIFLVSFKTFGLFKSCFEICDLIPRGIILSFLHLFMNFKWFCKRALLMWLCSNVLASLLCRSPNRSLMILKRLSRRYGTVISPSSACFATSAIFPRIFDTQLVSSSGEWGQSTFWRTYNPLLGPQNAISVPGQFSVSFYPIGWFSFWVFALIKWESFSLFEYFLYFI